MIAPTCRTIVGLAIVLLSHAPALFAADAPRPNIVLIFADDLGYSDLGCFGAKDIHTPNINRLAVEGTRFTSFYVSQPVCTASRASLMTGCYANRVGLAGALNHTSKAGIHADEVLLPELLQQRGYATAIFGKWHLGHRPEFSPLRHGFGEFFGIPYSNDNGPLHPVVKTIPSLPLIDGDKTDELDPDQSQFTRRLTQRACQFLAANKDRPFFLYVPHVMPHVPIFASERFKGRSARGLYGDVVEELDWSVGEIDAALNRLGLAEKTLVIFASDNGPFLSYGEHAGRATPLREGKLTTFEGGVRTPCLMRWPRKIRPGRICDEPVASIDLLPTIAKLVRAPLPKHPIDGLDVWPILSGQSNARTPHESLLFFSGDELQAIRSGDWKLHFAHDYLTVAGPPGQAGKPANFEKMQPKSIEESGIRGIASRHGYEVRRIEQSLFNLKDDLGESCNVADKNPEVVRRLEAMAEQARGDLGDSLSNRRGSGVRVVR
ncbi:MAG: arylsulfatase [Planctomycetota bacterium]|nr:MAG: arylsulfatase [Planctomycetota bacterium]